MPWAVITYNFSEEETVIAMPLVLRHVERSKMPTFFFGCCERARSIIRSRALGIVRAKLFEKKFEFFEDES